MSYSSGIYYFIQWFAHSSLFADNFKRLFLVVSPCCFPYTLCFCCWIKSADSATLVWSVISSAISLQTLYQFQFFQIAIVKTLPKGLVNMRSLTSIFLLSTLKWDIIFWIPKEKNIQEFKSQSKTFDVPNLNLINLLKMVHGKWEIKYNKL